MPKYKLKIFFKRLNELILVLLQFVIIFLHFIKWKFIPEKEILQVGPIFNLMGFLIIIVASLIMIIAIKQLGINLSPFPRPKDNCNLITSGIYSFMRHPMYYSLILLSFGVFITKLTIYYLVLTISLALIIKFKIILEEQYLKNKFRDYFLYKNKVKY